MNIIKKIEVFGDSILKGIQINPDNMRYCVNNQIDTDAISERYSVTIENHSRFGCTVVKGYSLVKKFLEKPVECDTVIMDFGGNDCDFNWSEVAERPLEEHKPNTPPETFVDVYHKIIDLLSARNILPIMTTLPPLAPQKFFNWFCKGLNKENIVKFIGDINAIYRFQERYSRTVERIAAERKVPLVDLRGAFLSKIKLENYLCQDGAHPNTEGQKLITEAFLDFAARWRTSRLGLKAALT